MDELLDTFQHPAEASFEMNQDRQGRRRHGAGSRGQKGGDTKISKALSRLLRHQAENAGVKLDREGYARLDHVLNWPPLRSLNPTVADVRRIVHSCEKKRFTLKPNPSTTPPKGEDSNDPTDFVIRANQGHSIKVESDQMLAPITAETIPPTVMHGTFYSFWSPILDSGGLKRQGRQHIHCTTGTPEDDVVGMRKDAELVIVIDVVRSIEDGFRWWKSENGYILTEGDEDGLLPLKYFREVRGRLGDVGLLMKDGEIMSNLPEEVKFRTPIGKGGGAGGKRNGKGGRDGRRR